MKEPFDMEKFSFIGKMSILSQVLPKFWLKEELVLN